MLCGSRPPAPFGRCGRHCPEHARHSLDMSGQRRKRLFLAKHLWCCFCGGSVRATTIDHVPARALFIGRAWPEGYEFPACDACNAASRASENVVAAISRCRPDPKTPGELAELRRLVEGIRNNDSATFLEMTDPVFKAQIARQSSSLILPRHFVDNLPVIHLGPLTLRHLAVFAEKLTKALHYLHTDNIVSPNGRVYKAVYSNSKIALDGLPVVYEALPATPKMTRNKTVLNDQFHYRYGITRDHLCSQFTAWFRDSFVIAGLVNDRPESKPKDSSDSPGVTT
jgi:hypothetical protein